MEHFTFDDSTITWHQIEGFDHLSYFICSVDRDNRIVDVLFKFAANEKIALHRHVAQNNMLVIQGDHILYTPEGEIKEIRPTGRYTVSAPDDEPHREGGGDQDVIILFSIRGTDGLMYEVLNDEREVISTLGMDDFENLYAAQSQA